MSKTRMVGIGGCFVKIQKGGDFYNVHLITETTIKLTKPWQEGEKHIACDTMFDV